MMEFINGRLLKNSTSGGPFATIIDPRELDCGLPVGECDTVRTIKKVILAARIVVTCATIVCIVILGKYKIFIERIVCHLLVATLLAAVFTIYSDGRPDMEGTTLCIVQAFFIQLFGFAEFLWCVNFTIFLFLLMVKHKDTSNYEWLYTTSTWTLTSFTACLPLSVSGAYGPASVPFCWISDKHSSWRFAIYWYPVFTGLVLMVLAYVFMICHARRELSKFQGHCNTQVHHNTNIRTLVDNYLKPLTTYFALFLFINLVQLANRIQNERSAPLFVFVVIHMISITSYGIVLCALFFVSNGRKAFTRRKFQEGLNDLAKNLQLCRRPSVVQSYTFEPGSTLSPTFHQKTSNPTIDYCTDVSREKKRVPRKRPRRYFAHIFFPQQEQHKHSSVNTDTHPPVSVQDDSNPESEACPPSGIEITHL
ncbi:cyclic AMP receptor 1-like [Watersipora subatra]|uniref:cyclic AMP receptor 1-like n=1 Tax=Watersipora subatra TaxID=2589382 RepID=UPI00355BFF76